MLNHKHHLRRLLPQGAQQRWQQAEFNVIRQTDAKGHGAGGRIKLAGQAQRRRQGVQRRREVLDQLFGPCGGFHAVTDPDEQRVVEHHA
ncbi:hypothetical protein D3C80_1271560 [compost metagenome]